VGLSILGLPAIFLFNRFIVSHQYNIFFFHLYPSGYKSLAITLAFFIFTKTYNRHYDTPKYNNCLIYVTLKLNFLRNDQ